MLSQAFWYLGTGVPRVWDFVAQDAKLLDLKAAIAAGKQIKSKRQLMSLVALAEFNSSDLDLLNDKLANDAIKCFLVRKYFEGRESHVFNCLKSL